MARTASGPGQATIPLARKTPQDLYYECLDEGKAFKFGGQGVIHQVQVDCLLVISCKISLPVIQIWSLHFCLAIIVWESFVVNSCIWH